MARGRNLQAFVKGYLKGEVAKQEQAAEQARLLREAEQKKASEKLAFNSSVVKGVITQNPEMFKELNMGYDQLTSDAGLQTVLSYVKDKDTDDKIKDTYLNASLEIIKKQPELFKGLNVKEYDTSTVAGQQDLFMAATNIATADKTTDKKDDSYRTFGEDGTFKMRFINKPSSREDYISNLNNMTNALITFPEDFENLPLESRLEFVSTYENMGTSAYSKHLSEQNTLKTNNEQHQITGLAFPQIQRLKNYKQFGNFSEFLTALKRNKSYDLVEAEQGRRPTMIGEKKNENNTEDKSETIVANFERKGILAPLMTYLDVPDEEELGAAYPTLVSSNNAIFKLAQQIIALPGITPPKGLDGKVIPYADDPTAKSLLQLQGNAFNMPTEVKQTIGIALLDAQEQGMSPEDAMKALGLAINRDFDDSGQVTDNSSIQGLYNQVIYQLTKQTGREGQTKITDMANNALDALTLAKSYLGLIQSKQIKTGAAGTLENVFVNLVGEKGQLDQLRTLFNNDDADSEFGQATFRDGGYDRVQKELDAVEENMKKYKTDARRKAYGEAAALKIYLAYTLAKVFDPSGRVSDKDLDNVLSAFTGGSITSTDYIEGMLGVSIDRLEQKYQKFNILSAYDPMSTKMADVRRITGAVAYSHIMSETDAEVVKDKKAAVRAMDISDGSEVGLRSVPEASYVDKQGNKRNVYQVFYKQLVNNQPVLTSPIFVRSAGLYVFDGASTSNGYGYLPSAKVLTTQQSTPLSNTTDQRKVDSVIGGIEYDVQGNRLN